GVPRRVAAACSVVMTELCGAGAAARPVLAGMIGAVGKRRAIELRTGQHVVTVRCVADAVDHLTLFGQRCLLGQVVAAARSLERVTVQICDALRDAGAFDVEPGTRTDAIARVDGGLGACSAGAEVSVPGPVAGPDSSRKGLTVAI